MTSNPQVPSYLKKYFPDKQVMHASISGEDRDVKNFGLKARFNDKWALVLASVEANDKKITEKIAMVSDIITDGVLLLFRFGVYSKGSIATFLKKTIIVTGKLYYDPNFFLS